MDIIIPSSGRPDRQPTLEALVQAGLKPILVVQEKEFHTYCWHWLTQASIVPLPPHITTIAPTRQFILEHVGKDDRFVMCDDDLWFYTRRSDDRTKLRELTPHELREGFAMLDDLLRPVMVRHVAHAGFAAREGANRNTDGFIHNTRIMRVLGYRRSTLIDEGIRFDAMEVMEDFHVALSLLEKGYGNIIANNWCHNQAGSGAQGGCSTWRTPELQARAAHRLAELHPGLVRVVQKETKTAWGGGVRTDVVVQWKKAFERSYHEDA